MASGKRISFGVVRNYKYSLQLLKAFEATQKQAIRIVPLNNASLSEMRREGIYWQKFFDRFCRFLYHSKGYSDNYVCGTIKIIKTVFKHLKLQTGIQTCDFYRGFWVPLQQLEPVVVLPEQLHFLIHNDQFHALLPGCLQRTKDIFIFGCTTGLRVGDLMNLRKQHLLIQPGEMKLVLHTHKTGTRVEIPLPGYCRQIIERYKHMPGGYLLPRLSITNLNLQIKAIGQRAGWDWTLPKFQSRKGKAEEIKDRITGASWKYYQHLSTHTMRRTAITTLLMMGVEEEVVRRISGHAPGSKQFYRYIALAQSFIDSQVMRAHHRLSTNPESYRTQA